MRSVSLFILKHGVYSAIYFISWSPIYQLYYNMGSKLPVPYNMGSILIYFLLIEIFNLFENNNIKAYGAKAICAS